VYHSTLGLRVINKKREGTWSARKARGMVRLMPMFTTSGEVRITP